MSAKRILLATLIGVGLSATQAHAVQLPPNGMPQALTAADADDTSWGIEVASKDITPTPATDGINTFAPRLVSTVYRLTQAISRDGVNFNIGDLVFGFQMFNTDDSTTLLQEFNVGGFNIGVPPGGYVATYVDGSGLVPDGGVASNTNPLSTQIQFSFIGNELAPGSNSAEVLIFTHAKGYRDSLATLQDTSLSTPMVPSFAPVPEPSTMAMAGIALPLLGLGYLRRRRGQA